MYCKHCGKETNDNSDICNECKQKTIFEPITEEGSVKTETINQNSSNNSGSSANTTYTTVNTSNNNQKSKIAAGLFGIFLGALGIHNFYLGYTGKGIAQLLLSVLTCGVLSFISAVWGLIEGILILSGDINTDADGRPLRD